MCLVISFLRGSCRLYRAQSSTLTSSGFGFDCPVGTLCMDLQIAPASTPVPSSPRLLERSGIGILTTWRVTIAWVLPPVGTRPWLRPQIFRGSVGFSFPQPLRRNFVTSFRTGKSEQEILASRHLQHMGRNRYRQLETPRHCVDSHAEDGHDRNHCDAFCRREQQPFSSARVAH